MSTRLQRAIELGQEHGENAAGWWIQENLTKNRNSKEVARMVIAYENDCEPSSIPQADLSGQWADSLTATDVLREIHEDPEHEVAWELGDDNLITAYEEAFHDTAVEVCLAACHAELGDDE